jgi:surface polysaccharide O-acyltransferase-like enzyme
MTTQKRIVFLDYLRVMACFMVMAIHSAEPFYLGGDAPNITHIASRLDMLWITVTECLCRVCVPLFVMASSYLLFPVSRPTGEFFKRRLLRVAVPFVAWAVAYVWAANGEWERLLYNFPDEGGHLWFVPMLLGLYLLMPLLSPWAEKVSERELRGWLAVWLFTTTFPFLRRAWETLYGAPSFGAVPYLYGECPWNMFGTFHYVSGFVGYMLLGLWFRKFAAERSWARTLAKAVPMWVAGVAVIGIPFFFYADKFPFSAPYAHAVKMEMSIEYCSIGVALTTIAAFMVVRKFHFDGAFYRLAVRPVSEASYGMYLLHMFILAPVSAALNPHLPTPLAILATAAVSFAASAFAAIVLRRLPIVGKWIC